MCFFRCFWIHPSILYDKTCLAAWNDDLFTALSNFTPLVDDEVHCQKDYWGLLSSGPLPIGPLMIFYSHYIKLYVWMNKVQKTTKTDWILSQQSFEQELDHHNLECTHHTEIKCIQNICIMSILELTFVWLLTYCILWPIGLLSYLVIQLCHCVPRSQPFLFAYLPVYPNWKSYNRITVRPECMDEASLET